MIVLFISEIAFVISRVCLERCRYKPFQGIVMNGFHPNMITLRSGTCYHPSLCRLSVVHAPYSAG